MNERVQIYTDEDGNKSSVIVPYLDWANLNSRVKLLEKKLKVFASIRDARHEVIEARKSGRKLQSLSSFINESRG